MSESKRTRTGDLTRRTALGRMAAGGTAGVMAVSGVARGAGIPGSDPGNSAMLLMGYDQWQPFVGQQFWVQTRHGNRRHALRLEQAIDETRPRQRDSQRPDHLRARPASLLFSSDQEMADGSLTVTHPRLGTALLFFHRTVRDNLPHRVIYQVILN